VKARVGKILFLILGAFFFVGACGSRSGDHQTAVMQEVKTSSETGIDEKISPEPSKEVNLTNEQKQLYETYAPQLDEMLANNERRIENCEQCQELVSSIYLFSEDYHGWLQGDHDADGLAMLQMLIEYGEQGNTSDDKQKYVGCLLEDGSLWLTYQSTYDGNYDLPDYVVNENVLRYSRVDYVYDDGLGNVEEEIKERQQQTAEVLGQKLSKNKQEYWVHEGKIYQIDRENQLFIDATEDRGGLIVSFFEQQLERIACQIKVNESVLPEVEQWKPEGYSLVNDWNNIAVNDLNEDGMNDYVLALYPDDFVEVPRYEEFSPYDHSSEYQVASFWLLLSTENKSYEQIQLTDTIDCRVDCVLKLVEVAFVKEGILQLEYFVGRSPYYNSVIQFKYDNERKNFYVYRSYFREDFTGDSYMLLIGDETNYGDTSMWFYFDHSQSYCETRWNMSDDNVLAQNVMISSYISSFEYACTNLVEEHHINSLIWNKEYELTQELPKKYENMDLSFYMHTESVFYNESIISGQVEGMGHAVSDNKNYDVSRFACPIMIDKNTGNYVHVTECIDKESFLQIFENWASEKRNAEELETGEKKYFEKAIANYWEKADTIEHSINAPEEMLCLQIVPEGIMIGVRAEGETWLEYCIIDKEYFLGTELWKYLKPEWM